MTQEMLAPTQEDQLKLFGCDLIDLLRREGNHSRVWFAGRLLQAADELEAFARHRLSSTPTAADRNAVLERYRHKARGTEYDLIGTAELQDASGQRVEEGALLAIYRGDDGKLWARRCAEFGDGRFERLPLASASPTAAADMPGLADDVSTLDVFLAAYADYSDGEVIASVVDPADDLLTLGALRRILSALSRTPATDEAVLVKALEPFAAFDDGRAPEHLPITQGSSFARKQLTIGDCRRAREALATLSRPGPGQSPTAIVDGPRGPEFGEGGR
jgi:hypothetical protein